MNLSRTNHEIEFRDPEGQDHVINVEVWTDIGRQRAVLVLRDLPHSHAELLVQARLALQAMLDDWLPYLLEPDAQVLVLALRPRQENQKARAVVLPLSA